jgi:hypothetical protein
MEEKTTEHTQSNYLTDIIDKYKNHNLFYLKLDLWLLAGIGTVMSLLKLDTLEIYKGIVNYKKPFMFLIALIAYQLVCDHLLFGTWVIARIKSQIKFQKLIIGSIATFSVAQTKDVA